jgi:hypothetical protein
MLPAARPDAEEVVMNQDQLQVIVREVRYQQQQYQQQQQQFIFIIIVTTTITAATNL